MNAASLFAACLEAEGVEYVFGVPGEENEALLFALAESTIRFVPCRHEQGAAFIANLWGRLTGRAGVCLSTLGPGATNLLTGVADANLDKAPVVAITGQGGRSRLHHESHQAIDVVSMFRPVTKWNTAVATADVVPEVVRKAFKLAEYEKPGATHIELSEDVAAEVVAPGTRPLKRTTVRRPAPDPQAVADAARRLSAAKRPLVLAGNGCLRKRASRDLRSLAERLDLPVASTFMGKGAVSDRSPRSLKTIGSGMDDPTRGAFEACDLVLAVGYDIAELPPERWNPDGSKPILHIDFEPAEVYEHYTPDIEIVGDIAASLGALKDATVRASAQRETGWYDGVRQRLEEEWAAYPCTGSAPFPLRGVLRSLRQALPDDGLLLSDVGRHKMWIGRSFPTYEPSGCIISNGLASMGIALPGAIAASLLESDRAVVAVMGDGGFLMNAQELETATRLGVGFTVVVLNDNDYGLIRWKQLQAHTKATGTALGNPDFVAFGESFGITSVRPANADELESALEEAVASRSMRLIEVTLAPQDERRST